MRTMLMAAVLVVGLAMPAGAQLGGERAADNLAMGCAPINYHAKSNIGDDMFTNLVMTNTELRLRSVGLWDPSKPGVQWAFVSELLVNQALFVKAMLYRRIPNAGYERPGTWTCWCWSTSSPIRSATECPRPRAPVARGERSGSEGCVDTLHTKRRSTGFSS